MTGDGSAPAPVGLDRAGMLLAIGSLGLHLRDGYEAGRSAAGLPAADGVRALAVCGMGGSGIPGDMVRVLLQDRLGIPIVVSKGYRLPEFCHTDTLVFAISYSGNTEETVTAYRDAVARGCRVVAIASDGELATRTEGDGVPRIAVPATFPAPRAAVGFLTGAVIGVLEATGLGPPAGPDVEEAVEVLGGEAPRGEDDAALALARRIGRRIPVTWGSEGIAEAAAMRWRTEINENAKRPAFSAAFPELDHNEIEGWSDGAGEGFFLVALRSASEHASVAPRLEATLRAIEGARLEHAEVRADGHGALAQLFSLVQQGGFVSCHLALEAGFDPTPVERIEAMKARLRELA